MAAPGKQVAPHPSPYVEEVKKLLGYPSPGIDFNAKLKKPRVTLPIVQGQAPAISVIQLIDRYLYSIPVGAEPKHTTEVHLGGPRSRGVFHPSDICKEEQCKRYLAYELFSAPQDESRVDARLRRIFDNGHHVHARLQHMLKQAALQNGGDFFPEVGLPPNEMRISGTTDGGLILGGWPYLIEIKSMNKRDFTDLGARPWPDHYRQVNIYMQLAKVTSAIVLVECKDNQDLREYFVRYDPEMWAETEVVAADTLDFANRGDLPPIITEKEGCHGKRCKFHNICKGAMAHWRPDGPLVPLTRKPAVAEVLDKSDPRGRLPSHRR